MYQALLRAQWKSISILVMLLCIICFGLPLVQVLLTPIGRSAGGPEDALVFLSVFGSSSEAYPIVAYVAGGLMALGCWSDDAQAKHVYALTLPVPRWYYLLLRMSIGMTLLAAPVLALWLASLIGLSQLTLPPGLHAYPTGLAVRFGLAAAFSFCLAYAIGSASQRVLLIILWTVVAAFAVVVVMAATGMTAPLDASFDAIFNWPGFVDIFTGRWLLVDV